MQSLAFALFAALSPLPAAAFGNLDCITFESCTNGVCSPEVLPFSVTFDWAAQAVIVSDANGDVTLPWRATGETDDGLASVLEYGLPDISTLLRVEASGRDITAYYTYQTTPGASALQTWVASCNVRQAA